MKTDLFTVKRFSFPSDVPVVSSFMEMNEIPFVLKNMAFSQLAYSAAVDIEMQVSRQDALRAIDVLFDGGFLSDEERQRLLNDLAE